jgi:hypothetical protein
MNGPITTDQSFWGNRDFAVAVPPTSLIRNLSGRSSVKIRGSS